MRTTLQLDDDVLAAARVLARRALVAPPHGLENSPGNLPEERNGLPLLPWTPKGAPVDLELVNRLRDVAP